MVRLITFEGGDGTGKTTQIRALASHLHGLARSAIVTREPGGTAFGTLMRKALLEVGEHEIASSTELFLYLADRAQHVNEIILPAIHARTVVLCDRFTDSTLAYQGYGRGIDLEWLRRLNDHASAGVRPDLTFLFDCPVEISLARTARRRTRLTADHPKVDRFEQETAEFHERVRQGFLKMAETEPQRFRVIDASKPVEEISEVIRRITDQELRK